MRLGGGLLAAIAGAVLLAAAPAPGSAQGVEETRLLREAAARESRGDFEGAERVLRRLLEASPSSSGGLFALERVLRSKGDLRAVLPAVDTFLAREPEAAGVRHLKLRVLVELDSLGAVEEEAEGWLRAQSGSETAYREVARIYGRAFGPERALEVLGRGRSALGRPDAFALERGDLLADAGSLEEAMTEYAAAVGPDGARSAAIARRVAALADPRAAPLLVEALARAPEAGRRRAGALIAVDTGLEEPALEMSRDVLEDLDPHGRVGFLADVARRARDAGMGEVAAWAYAQLGDDARSPSERRQFDQRLVELSLAEGDTATAVEAQARVVASFTEGSADQRRATAELVRLESAGASAERLRALIEAFRRDFPDAPELDDVAAGVASILLARGDPEGAAAVLEGVDGPRSSLQRGYLLLAAGDVAGARSALLTAVPGLEPTEATGVIQFVSLLGRLSPEAVDVLARAGVRAHEGAAGEAAALVRDALGELPEKERPAMLAEGARLAERGGEGALAAELRTRLLQEHPDAPESAEAALALARWHAASPEGREEAIRLLEDLVVRSPDAAVVPDARRELERLRRSG